MQLTSLIQLSLRFAVVLYPLYVWWAVQHWHPAAALLPAVAIALLKSCSRGTSTAMRGFFLLSSLVLLIAIFQQQSENAMLYYPVWVNAGMFLLFTSSLWFPPPIVERIARMMEGELDPVAIAYTRKVTQVWAGFFFINGCIAFSTAWLGNWDLWLLYNGAIAYGLMGLLMLIEWLVRRRVKAAK
jgi:uncharacterized membrane protein